MFGFVDKINEQEHTKRNTNNVNNNNTGVRLKESRAGTTPVCSPKAAIWENILQLNDDVC